NGAPQQFFARAAPLLGGGVVDVDVAPVEVEDLTAFHHRVERLTVALLAGSQGQLGLFALGDVDGVDVDVSFIGDGRYARGEDLPAALEFAVQLIAAGKGRGDVPIPFFRQQIADLTVPQFQDGRTGRVGIQQTSFQVAA